MKLTQEQIKNLLIFLNRTQLNGQEAEVLVQIKMILAKELERSEEVKEEKPNGK